MVKKVRYVFVILTVSILSQTSLAQENEINGEELFRTICKACHTVHTRMVGPPLAGVTDKYNEEYLLRYIKSSQTVIQSGEPDAVAIFNEYNQVIMPDQDLTNDQIRAILGYIDEEAQAALETEGDITRPVVEYDRYLTPLNFGDYIFWLPYTLTMLVVIGVLYWLIEINSSLRDKAGQ